MKKGIEEIVVKVDDETKRKNEEGLAKWHKKTTQKEVVRLHKELSDNLYASSDWSRLRALKLKENEFCEICGKPTEQIHHIFPWDHQVGDYKKIAFNAPYNLMSLCTNCHKRLHANKLLPNEKAFVEQTKERVSNIFLDNKVIISWL